EDPEYPRFYPRFCLLLCPLSCPQSVHPVMPVPTTYNVPPFPGWPEPAGRFPAAGGQTRLRNLFPIPRDPLSQIPETAPAEPALLPGSSRGCSERWCDVRPEPDTPALPDTAFLPYTRIS